jgi:hypothetical protein
MLGRAVAAAVLLAFVALGVYVFCSAVRPFFSVCDDCLSLSLSLSLSYLSIYYCPSAFSDTT